MSHTVVCDACDTEIDVAPAEIAATITQHNNLHHNGDRVASVASSPAPSMGAGDD